MGFTLIIPSISLTSTWLTALALLLQSVRFSSSDWSFGQLSINNLVSSTTNLSLAALVVITNLPQILISWLYIFYNGLLTSMTLTAETSSFATERKFIRVSDPVGKQRSTYYLQLPYRYAITLLTAMTLLHWLVSRSLFLVKVTIINASGIPTPSRDINACGWSRLPLILALGVGLVMILTLFGLGWRRFAAGMPLLGSCSLAISAACHPAQAEGENIAEFALQYGVIDNTDTPHVAFSRERVRPLVRGVAYA
jgi:hypothetical protein